MIRLWSKVKIFFGVLVSSLAQYIQFKFESLRTHIIPKFTRYKHRAIRYWKLHARYPFTDAVALIIGVLLIPIFLVIIVCDGLVNVWNYEPVWYIKVVFVALFVYLYFTNSLPQEYQDIAGFLSMLYIPVILYYYGLLFDWSMPTQCLVSWMATPFLAFFILRAAAPHYVRNDYFDPWGIIFYTRLVNTIRAVLFYVAYKIFYWLTYKVTYWYYAIYDFIDRSLLVAMLRSIHKKYLEFLDWSVGLYPPWLIDFIWNFAVFWPKRFSNYWPDGFYDDVKLFFFKIPHTYTYNFIVKSYYKIRFIFLTSRFYNYIDDWYRFKFKPFLLRYTKKEQISLPIKLTVDQIRRLPPGTVIAPKPIRITISIRYKKFKKKLANCYRIFIFNKKIFIFITFLVVYLLYRIFSALKTMLFYTFCFLYIVVKIIFMLVYIQTKKL